LEGDEDDVPVSPDLLPQAAWPWIPNMLMDELHWVLKSQMMEACFHS